MSSSSPILTVLNQPTLTVESLQSRIDGLWQALETVTDPRKARGLRYRLPLLLSLAVLAVAAGAKTFLEIAENSADLPTRLLAELGVCSWSGTPSNWTFSRVLAKVDHDELDQALSGWTMQEYKPAEAVAVDGKTMRAATTGGDRHAPNPGRGRDELPR
ncbi:transposase family protein [Saccharopolyspora hattusasensis]|uniref:transposase family protein n=1 Tax=Saccharopolyspora hattusasensis TaxID=1128679 RepID=UPI003D955F2B